LFVVMKRTLYQILGVETDATAEAITAAYRAKLGALQVAPGSDAAALTLLREAYQVLSNAPQRAAYDASLAAPVPSGVARRGRAVPVDDGESGAGWMKWAIGASIVLIALGLWWWKARPAPKPEGKMMSRVVITQPAAPPTAEPAPRMAIASAAPESAVPAPATRSAEDVFAQVSASVARVNALDGSGRTTMVGSGVVVERGAVITNCHVVSRASAVQVKLGSALHSGSVEVADEELDLCRLSVPGLDAPAVQVGPVSAVRTGQRVYAIGAPQGLDLTISEGIVSSLRDVPGGTVIQTTAPVSRGSSGGGLFDASGRLVGIVTFQHRYGQNLNFALPADWIGEMRARRSSTGSAASSAASGEVGGRAASTQRAADDSPASLIVGSWQCFGSVSGRSGTYTYGADGVVTLMTNDGLRGAGRYAVSGRSVRYSMTNGSFAYAIEHLDGARLVLNIGVAGQRLACERR
jgi:S1-C subfamily serine protease